MSFIIQNILVATDFSECADNALRVAIKMAIRHNATLHIIHIIDSDDYGYISDDNTDGMSSEGSCNKAINRLDFLEKNICSSHLIPVVTDVVMGAVVESIRNYLDAHSVDLVVLGKNGTSGINKMSAGLNTQELIKNNSIPFLSVPYSFTKESFSEILFPVRPVKGMLGKYGYIKPILEKNNATLTLLCITHGNDVAEDHRVESDMATIRQISVWNGYKMIIEKIKAGEIANAILQIAANSKSDMLIINSSSHKKWYHFFKKSFYKEIINLAEIPVLVVNPSITMVSGNPSKMNMLDMEYYYPMPSFV